MDDTDILIKTPQGAEELRSRSQTLPPRLRTVLILVDGATTARSLKKASAAIGAPPDALETLIARGLVQTPSGSRDVPAAPVAAESAAPAVPESNGADATTRFRAAQKFMNDTAVDSLGFRSFFFTLKLEKCANLADLAALLPEYTRIMAKSSGDAAAGALEGRVRELLA